MSNLLKTHIHACSHSTASKTKITFILNKKFVLFLANQTFSNNFHCSVTKLTSKAFHVILNCRLDFPVKVHTSCGSLYPFVFASNKQTKRKSRKNVKNLLFALRFDDFMAKLLMIQNTSTFPHHLKPFLFGT